MAKKRARKIEPNRRGLGRGKRKKKRAAKPKAKTPTRKPAVRRKAPKRLKSRPARVETRSATTEATPVPAAGVSSLPATEEVGKAKPGECVDADRVFEACIAIPRLAHANRRILDAPNEREEAKKRAKAAFENLPGAPTRELADAIVRLEGYAKSGYVPQSEGTDEYSQMQRDLNDLHKWQFDLRAEARMQPFAVSNTNIQLLKEQQEDWKQGAAQLHDVQARLALGLNADREGLFRDDQGRHCTTISGATSWRIESGGMVVAPPPREELAGEVIHHPDSPTPKPWAYFEDDQPDVEHFTVAVYGTESSRSRYKELAGSSWRLLETNRSPSLLRMEVDRSRRFLPIQEDWVRWTLFLFRMVWGGQLPASVRAKKWLWLTDTHRIEADKPLTQMLIDNAMRHVPDNERSGLGWVPAPGRCRDYGAVLEPDLFTASAAAMGTLLRMVDRSRPAVVKAPKDNSPASKSRMPTKVVSAKERAEERARKEAQWREPEVATVPVPFSTAAKWFKMKDYRTLQRVVNERTRACRRVAARKFIFDLEEVKAANPRAATEADPGQSER